MCESTCATCQRHVSYIQSGVWDWLVDQISITDPSHTVALNHKISEETLTVNKAISGLIY